MTIEDRFQGDFNPSRIGRILFGSSNSGNNSQPMWTPDSQRLIFTSERDGEDRIYSQLSDTTGAAEPITPPEAGVQQWPDSLTPDGATLSFTNFGGDIVQIVWTVSIDEGSEPELSVVGGQGGDTSGGSAGRQQERPISDSWDLLRQEKFNLPSGFSQQAMSGEAGRQGILGRGL